MTQLYGLMTAKVKASLT